MNDEGAKVSMKITMRCPRRSSALSALIGDSSGDNEDHWEPPKVHARVRDCSYCGSMHPNDFMQAARDGAELGPTDKNYKVYVAGTNGDPDKRGKFYFQHLSKRQCAEFVDLINEKTPEGERKLNIGYPGHFYTLPFFIQKL